MGPRPIAALYVETEGVYYGLPGVDPWDRNRDARRYDGPHPVIAHPPCNAWCQLARVNEARWGFRIGEDGGTFAAALAAVRRWGGVLEHPAQSMAWTRYELPRPMRGGWTQSFTDPGMAAEISQAAYGHDARKRTWLYAVGIDPSALTRWTDPRGRMTIGHNAQRPGRKRIRGAAASRTPVELRDVLIALARTVDP